MSFDSMDRVREPFILKKPKQSLFDGEKIGKALIVSHQSSMYTFWHESLDMLCIVSSFIYAHFAAQRHEDESMHSTMKVIECIFLVDCLLTFVKDYKNPNDP
jgi:hypothetical protein